MKRIALIIISLISVSVISSPTFPFLTAENQFDELIPKAKAFVELMAAEKYSEGVADFDATMSKVMPEAKLKLTWEAVIKKVGSFKTQIGTRTEQIGKYDAVYVVCQFEKEKMDVKVVFDKEKKISALFRVKGLPDNWFFSKDGEIIGHRPGYIPPDTFLKILKSFIAGGKKN